MRRTLNLFLTCAALWCATPALAQQKIILTHPEIAPPTLIDHGKPGQSIGDMRIFQFAAKADDGTPVLTDWIMTTTGLAPEKGAEHRITSAIFSFGSGTDDQLVIQGVAKYPSAKATLKESTITKRAITGGTGKFAGVGGWMETEHLSDGSWRHTLYLK